MKFDLCCEHLSSGNLMLLVCIFVDKPLKETLHIEVFFLSSPSVSSFVAIIYCYLATSEFACN